ncbi:MAG: isopeptide-forming domain-containing fimbrial protein [Protaetiibacter sp.]
MTPALASPAPLPTRRSLRRHRDRRRWPALTLVPALVLSSIGLAVWGGGALSATAAIDPPVASLTRSGEVVLAGEDATFAVTLANEATADGFNIGFTVLLPNGVTFESSPMGTPVVYASGAALPNSATAPAFATVPLGSQLWVFEDVADLPMGARYASSITVRPDAALFPVGAVLHADLTGYVSSDAALRPIFDGSTGVGGAAGLAATSADVSAADVRVQPLRVRKSEPSPEDELLRGVHANRTTYTLTIENTPQGPTDDVTVVDYLPAGLEFLGCGAVDNTQSSPLLAGTAEYPGAGSMAGTALPGCIEPDSVETVNSGLPADLAPGVYTKVTWTIPALAAGTPQSYPGAAGVAGERTLSYVAAVPLFENTMSFVTAETSSAPTAASLGQTANLNNNNGASTRQGPGAGFGDGRSYVNTATVSGRYGGLLAAGASASVSASDTERIVAMDLRVLKSVDTGSGGTTFDTGRLATFRLQLDTGEYTSADRITLVDTLPNGLCPAIPGGPAVTGDALPSECETISGSAGAPVLSGATVTSIDYDAATGSFAITFVPSPQTIAADGTLTITYTALMRSGYDAHEQWTGNTSSGDSLVNRVEFDGWTSAIDALDGVTNGDAVAAGGEQDVWDDSSARITSDYSSISKRVLARDAVVAGPATAADACAVAPTSPAWADTLADDTDIPFHQGDLVCYELTVDFATQIDVRNPIVTDFLPADVTYLDSAVFSGAGIDVGAPARSGQRVQWTVGTVGSDGDRFVPLGSRLVLHVLGTLTHMTSATATALDKPENLMKYRQENVLGDVFFQRDASAIRAGQGPTLVKGVRDIDDATTRGAQSQLAADGSVFGSNRDGIQVVQGDVVTYRIDLTGGGTDAALTVWDALPAGISAADVTDTGGGVAVDPGDPGYPANSQYPTRSLVIWTDVDVAAGAQRALLYDVTVPVGVAINTTLGNTASITSYDVDLNSGQTGTFYPAGSLDRTTRGADEVVPGEGTRDDSAVYTPTASITKTLVRTEVGAGAANLDTRNGDGAIVQGELVTYSYSVTVPAHTSVRNAVLRDRGTLTGSASAFTVASGSWSSTALTGAVASDFGFAAIPGSGSFRGVLTFPSTYTNTSDDPQVFTVTLTGYVGDAGNNNATLTNQAQFRSATWDGDATRTVTYLEPNLDITKAATSPSGTSSVSVSDTVTYTLTVPNNTNRVKSYDNTVVDTVPAGLLVNTASLTPAPASFSPGIATGAGGTITWNIAEIPATATLSYTAQIDPSAGAAQSYVNSATVTGYTLPATVGTDSTTARRGTRTDTATATITAATAAIDKGVRVVGGSSYGASASAPIGQTVEYQVVTTLRAGVNYYDPTIVDDLPAGVVLDTASISGPTPSDGSISGTWTRTFNAASNLYTWTYSGDIPSAAVERTLTLSYRVLLANTVGAGVNSLVNSAQFSWNRTNDTPATRTSVTDSTTVITVLNPVLAIDKTVSNAAPDPGANFDYTVTVTNTGGTPAYNLVVTDTVPDGVIVDPSSISAGGTITGQGATGGGVITWDASDLPGPLHQQSSSSTPKSFVLTYTATLAPSAALGDTETFTNTARVTRFESFPSGGRVTTPANITDTAVVDPRFPNITLDKTVSSGDVAYAGSPFGWTLTLVNTGDGPAQTISVRDVLPKHWDYDAGSARIRLGTGAQTALADPSVTTAGDVQTLAWTTGQISAATPALPGTASGATLTARTIVITFTATPSDDALTDAGTTTPAGVRVPHTNSLRAVTTDTSGATGNESGSYTAADDTASAYIHAADLRITKTAAASPRVAGTTGTGWTIVVTNDGPDTAVGPITVSDTTGALPAGVVVTGASGTGWSCDAPTRGAGGVTTFDCARSNPADTLANGASFPAIQVAVQLAADQAATQVDNTAVVTPGRTHDPDPSDNDDSDPLDTTTAADLTITKTVSTAAPNAGSAISWQLAPRNLGPSVSVSASGARIVVTDTIPAGIVGVTDPSTADWAATVTRAGNPSTFPARAGDVITWTYQGTGLAVGAAPVITLSGQVDAAWTPTSGPGGDGSIVNEARIVPGSTSDPVTTNNTSSVPTTPGDDTTVGVTKTRVVWDADASAWVTAPASSDVVPGETVSYRVTVVNNGPADARTVRIVDEAPDGLSYRSHVSESGTWTRTAGATNRAGTSDAAWDTFALTGPQQSGAANARTFVVSYDVDPALDPTAAVVNWAEATAANASNAPRDDDSVGPSRVADLSIEKSHTGFATAGSTLAYRIVVTNEGPSSSSGAITVTDTLPTGFSYVASSARISIAGGTAVQLEPTVTGQLLSWTLLTAAGASLPLGSTIVVDLTTAIAPTVAPQLALVNVAQVSGPEDDDVSNNRAEDPTEVRTDADVSITKTVAAGPWIAGTDVTFTLTVTNAGPSAVAATLTDTLPTGLTMVSMSGAGWDCSTVAAGDQDGECSYTANSGLHPVGSANATTITVVARIAASVPTGTDLVNEARVAWVDSSGPRDDSDTAQITVTTNADLALVKTAIDEDGDEITSAVAGTLARYELVARNLGPSDAIGSLTVVDTLPAGVTFVGLTTASALGWSASAGAVDASTGEQLVTFTRTPSGTGLAAGASAPAIVFDVQLAPELDAVDSPRTNVATVSSGTPDATPGNNTDDAELDIRREVDVRIVKSHDPAEVRVGDDLPFQVDVANDGPSEATGITVADTVPAGLTVVSAPGDAVGTGWTLVSVTLVDAADPSAGAVVVASYADPLGPGAQAPTLTLITNVTAAAYPEVVNVVEVDVSETDTVPANNEADDTVTVPPLVTLVIEKTAVGAFQVGRIGTYRITVDNTGPTDDPGPITVEDVLPAGLRFASSPDAGVAVSGQTVTWTVPGIAMGDTVELTLLVRVEEAAYPRVTNEATVSTLSELTLASVTASDAAVAVAAAPPRLPLTGWDLALAGALALLLLLLGAIGVVWTRRHDA